MRTRFTDKIVNYCPSRVKHRITSFSKPRHSGGLRSHKCPSGLLCVKSLTGDVSHFLLLFLPFFLPLSPLLLFPSSHLVIPLHLRLRCGENRKQSYNHNLEKATVILCFFIFLLPFFPLIFSIFFFTVTAYHPAITIYLYHSLSQYQQTAGWRLHSEHPFFPLSLSLSLSAVFRPAQESIIK